MNSMTGYGRAVRQESWGRLGIELRSLNNRFLEVNPRLGPWFSHLEMPVRDALKARFSRGKIDVVVRFAPSEELCPPPVLNAAALRHLAAPVAAVCGGREGAVEGLLGARGIFLGEAEPSADDGLSSVFLQVLEDASRALAAERAREGAALAAALQEVSGRLRSACVEISAARPLIVEKYRLRLRERIETLLGPNGAALDPGRLDQEVALFADKADLAEECSRLEAHIDALDAALARKNKAVGKGLEFLSQELLREVNTIGSKCRDLDVARTVLDLKNDLESLRELVANIE